jgi:hypothetical protein
MDEIMTSFKTWFGTTFHPGCVWEHKKIKLNRKANRPHPPHPILGPPFPPSLHVSYPDGPLIVPSQNYNHLNPGASYHLQQYLSNLNPPPQGVLHPAAIDPSLSSTSVTPSTITTPPTPPAVHLEQGLDGNNPDHSPPSSATRGTASTPNFSILVSPQMDAISRDMSTLDEHVKARAAARAPLSVTATQTVDAATAAVALFVADASPAEVVEDFSAQKQVQDAPGVLAAQELVDAAAAAAAVVLAVASCSAEMVADLAAQKQVEADATQKKYLKLPLPKKHW